MPGTANPPAQHCFRLGRKQSGKPRPIKCILRCETEAVELLRSFNEKKRANDELLKIGAPLFGVSLSRDRTLAERNYLHELRQELERRINGGEEDLTIRYITGVPKILSKNEDSPRRRD